MIGPEITPPPQQQKAPPSRLRRFFTRHLPISVGAGVVLLIVALFVLYLWAGSSQCERLVRRWLIAQVEVATGGRVEIASFTWEPLHLEADAGGITIHGLEARGEAPYAQIANLKVRVSILGLISPRVLLRELDVSHPRLHLILYPDGSTNQPQPKHRQSGRSPINTLFDLKAGHVTVEQAVIDYDNRAAAFDFQNRDAPLDLKADDVSVLMRFVAAKKGAAEHYHLEAGVSDLNLSRGVRPSKGNTAHGHMQAILDLTRQALYLRSLQVISDADQRAHPGLTITGSLQDFGHPRWQAKALGTVDMRLLEPTTGYPFAPQGIAHVDLSAAGTAQDFRIDGPVTVENGAYIGTGVYATGVRLNARVHADPRELLISSVVARLPQGGEIDGTVALQNWLPPSAPAELHAAQGRNVGRARRTRVVTPHPVVIPVDGKVTAQFKGVSLDTILSMVSQPPYQRLGFSALVNGPATATWSHGDARSIVVAATLGFTPGTKPDENPLAGQLDATYQQRDGSVDLRNLDIHTPGNHVQAHGRLGAYPIHSPSSIDVDFESRNLAEFNTLLQSLGLHHNDKTGTAAIPVSLNGQADFHGTWTGSLADPHLAGNLKATSLVLEMPAAKKAGTHESRELRLDSADVTGSYSAAHIVIRQAALQSGSSRVSITGSLRNTAAEQSGFGAGSVLQAHLQGEHIRVEDLQPLLAQKLPVSGDFDTQLAVDGPLISPDATGSIQISDGTIYGEPFHQARVQGALTGRALKFQMVSISGPAGEISGAGNYDFAQRRFQINASGAGIDISRLTILRRQGVEAAGKLKFSVSGSGSLDDPQINGQATLTALALSGESLGGVQFSAHTAKHTLIFTGDSRMEGAQLTMRGQTALSGDYATSAHVTFSDLNVGALLRMAKVEGLTAESSLDGTVVLDGPLADPTQMRGDARLQELAVTLAGVHLKSDGGLHATLAGNRITLDPLHVTGDNTNLNAQGTLDLNGARRLDLAARGSVNLKLAETLDPDLTAAGTSTFQIEAHGPLKNPNLQGRVDFQDCSLSLGDLPNGLSQLDGTLAFNQNRLEVKSLTAMSGGGLLSVGGYLAYQHGIYADLSVTGKGIRIRYPQGISSLADATLRLEGPQNNLRLSGNVLITRFTVSPDLDVAALAAQANAAVDKIAPPEAPSNHIRLDVHVVSSPQLNFQNAYAKLAGDVDLRLRGTVANPSLLGRVSITEGAATIAGTRYELERGEITFTNPVRIEPNIDLTATARVSDYDITLDVHGTPARLAVNPRSDPPLPEADVISLLALGHTQNQERLYTAQQEQSLTNPTTDAILGGALNATVSNRIQRLFGAGSVKIDPHYLGALGNSTSRITVQEQFGRNVTFTYATDVDTTGQQLLQAEIAINRHVSLLVARDESGVFSMVIKTTRRYR